MQPRPEADDVPDIRTPRLDLVSLSPGVMRALLEHDAAIVERAIQAPMPSEWERATFRHLRIRLEQIALDGSARPWLDRAIVLRGPAPAIVGNAGFHAPPDARGAVEIGYQVIGEHRGNGYATEAATALIGWAWGEHGVERFVASVGPTNEPSLAILRRLGFEHVGSHWDEEDGEEMVYELIRRAPSSSTHSRRRGMCSA